MGQVGWVAVLAAHPACTHHRNHDPAWVHDIGIGKGEQHKAAPLSHPRSTDSSITEGLMTFNPHPAAHENHELELRIKTVSDYEGTVVQGKIEFDWDAFFTNEFEVQSIVCVSCDYQHLDRTRAEIV